MRKTCKFCQMPEGAPGGRHGVLHINRDGLCGPCATLLDKVKYQPEKVDAETMEQFVANCEWNYKHGLFVPVAQRRELRAKQPWSCKRCGRTVADNAIQAKGYVNYCTSCADEIRIHRDMPHKFDRKTRSDKGGVHRRNKKQ